MSYTRLSGMQRLMRWVITLGVLAGIGYAVFYVIQREIRPKTTVSIGTTIFHVDVAETEYAREKGLSGRSKMARNEGMLFVFDKDDDHQFWMKDMNMSIDIIWLDSHKKVIHVAHNVAPDAEPHEVYGAPRPSRYVLEVAAGRAKEAKIINGVTAKFNVAEEGV